MNTSPKSKVESSKVRASFEYTKKDQHQRSVETLGLSGHGSTRVVKNTNRINTPKRRNT